jgi:segregation and condensation protein A
MDEPVPTLTIRDIAAGWEYPAGEGTALPAHPDALPVLSVEGFEGPLDFLLEMVRRHRIDLGRLAILPLIEQFVAAFEAARTRVTLERRGDWLVMATTLLQLKAQLLWPATPDAAADAEAEAARRLQVLEIMAEMRAAAAWLAARPQLGVDVFPRGRGGPAPSP